LPRLHAEERAMTRRKNIPIKNCAKFVLASG
jgi:hypothetical protein